MGEGKKDDLRVSFDSRVKLDFVGSKITTDAGLLAYRELDETFGLTEMASEVLTDLCCGSNKQHQLVPLLRQSIYSRLAGYEDVNDAERLAVDPAMRHIVGGRTTFAPAEGLLSQLPISSKIMAASASRGRQDRVASRRIGNSPFCERRTKLRSIRRMRTLI